jgi:hypothetical protein
VNTDVQLSEAAHIHTHPHPHAHASEVNPELAQLGPSERGSVILDIGGDKGSLMILAPESLAGAEIEISRVGDDNLRTHIAIRERRAPNGTQWAGIFPPLLAGDYTVWNLDGSLRQVVSVVGGHVARVDWR